MSNKAQDYRKMHRTHRKTMIDLAKRDADWDWVYLHSFVMAKIQHMYEMYTEGYSIFQTEESLKVCIDSLQHILNLQAEIDALSKEDVLRGNMTAKRMEICEDGSYVSTIDEVIDRSIAEHNKRINDLYTEMYAYIGQHMQYWKD